MTKAAGAAAEGSGAETSPEPLEQRMLRSVESKMTAGSAAETASDEAEEEAEAPEVDETEEEAADAEGEESEGEEAAGELKPWTSDEIAQYMEANPRWFDTLDREGWSRVPQSVAKIYKVAEREAQRREENARKTAAQAAPQASRSNAKPKVATRDEIFELTQDPETWQEGMDLYLSTVLPEALERIGIKPAALQKVTATDVVSEAFALAAEDLPALNQFTAEELVQVERAIEANPRLLAQLQSGDPERMSLAFERAGRKVLEEKQAATESQKEAQRKKAEVLKAKELSKKAKKNASVVSDVVDAPASSGAGGKKETMEEYVARQFRERQAGR